MWVVILRSGIGVLDYGIHLCNEHLGSTWELRVAIGTSETANAVHRLTFEKMFSKCVVVNHTVTSEPDKTLECIEKCFPRDLWRNSWWHASPSCKKGSTANFNRQELDLCRKGTMDAYRVFKAADPAQFTIEQISRVMKHIELPNAVRIQLEEHCQLRQNRSRMIASKKPLKLVKYEGPQDDPTPEERFGNKYKMRLPLVLQNS